ncbi:MAG: iron-sulfur cluster assembly protein, partial [Mangrovicoccus sp.]
MSSVTKEVVLAELGKVRGPDRTDDLVSLGLVDGLSISGGKVTFAIKVPAARAQELEPMRATAQKVVE